VSRSSAWQARPREREREGHWTPASDARSPALCIFWQLEKIRTGFEEELALRLQWQWSLLIQLGTVHVRTGQVHYSPGGWSNTKHERSICPPAEKVPTSTLPPSSRGSCLLLLLSLSTNQQQQALHSCAHRCIHQPSPDLDSKDDFFLSGAISRVCPVHKVITVHYFVQRNASAHHDQH
jgi:hypothetical protein